MAEAVVTVCNKKGLHARAAAKFVKCAGSFDAEIKVAKCDDAGAPVSGTSILGLMMLGADKGSQLRLNAAGPQSQEALAAIKELIEGRFGEEE